MVVVVGRHEAGRRTTTTKKPRSGNRGRLENNEAGESRWKWFGARRRKKGQKRWGSWLGESSLPSLGGCLVGAKTRLREEARAAVVLFRPLSPPFSSPSVLLSFLPPDSSERRFSGARVLELNKDSDRSLEEKKTSLGRSSSRERSFRAASAFNSINLSLSRLSFVNWSLSSFFALLDRFWPLLLLALADIARRSYRRGPIDSS